MLKTIWLIATLHGESFVVGEASSWADCLGTLEETKQLYADEVLLSCTDVP